MPPTRALVLLALSAPTAAYRAALSSSRASGMQRTVARMEQNTEADRKREATEALERLQERSKGYNQDRKAAGKKDIPPATYNVLYGAIIALTARDAATNPQVTSWVADGASLDAVPFGAIGPSGLLAAYALFQIAFSFGTGTTTPFRLAVTKLGVTEPPFSSKLNDESRAGDYLCSSCGVKLFDSSAKFDSGSGWPAFWRTDSGGVAYSKELLGGRMEVTCQTCQAHLGHVFSDGPVVAIGDRDQLPATDPGGPEAKFELNDQSVHPRFCINGCALEFQERVEGEEVVGTLPKSESV